LTIAGSIPPGPSRPAQLPTSKPGSPDSAMVGRSGISADRLLSAIAIGRTRSDFSVSMAGTLPNSTCTWPPIKSTSAGFMPLFGTWTIAMPAMLLNSSAARCDALPTPAEP
jgi:hypothetical protein